MSVATVLPPALRPRWAHFDPLQLSAGFWLAVMLVGQWAFFYYIAAFYGSSIATGDLESWNRLAAFGRKPYVPGDALGNAAFASHALGAGVIALAGGLQLIPWVRRRFPTFHRWNGRTFVLLVTALSLSGFYLVWVRGTSPSKIDALATSLNGLLILGFAAATYVTARRRELASHREWAMRLYLVSNGQWFLRVGIFAYFGAMKAAGQSPSFSDPFFLYWKVGCFLVPLIVLQLYLAASRGQGGGFRSLVAVTLAAGTLAMALGAFIFGVLCQKIINGEALAL